MKKIEFFGSKREFRENQGKILSCIKKSIREGQYLQGPEVEKLENTMAKWIGRKYAVAVNSCTDALFFALIGAGVQQGDHVLVTDFSFVASASAILRAGAHPVFVDIDAETFLMDFQDAERKITNKTKALVLVHLYGQMINPEIAESFCQKHQIRLIEDAAQAIGANWEGRIAGSTGAASCISFDPTKPISAPGSGGVVLTDQDEIAMRIRRLRYHGRSSNKTHFEELGYNSQMPTLTASVLLYKLSQNHKWIQRRTHLAKLYMKELADIPQVRLPVELKRNSHIFHKFVVRCAERDELKSFLSKNGVETMVHYALPMHEHPCFKNSYQSPDNPVCRQSSREVLSLPIYPQLTPSEVRAISKLIRSFYTKNTLPPVN